MHSGSITLNEMLLGADPKTGRRAFLRRVVSHARIIHTDDSSIPFDIEVRRVRVSWMALAGYLCIIMAFVLPIVLIVAGEGVAAPFFALGLPGIGSLLLHRRLNVLYPGDLIAVIRDNSVESSSGGSAQA